MTPNPPNSPRQYKALPHKDATERLLDALVQENIPVYAPCGGRGICGKCKVQVTGDVSGISSEEMALLTPGEIENGIRLACRTYATGDAAVCMSQDTDTNHSKEKIKANRQYAANSRTRKLHMTIEAPDIENGLSLTACIKNELNDIHIPPLMIKKVSNTWHPGSDITFSLYGNELIDIEEDNTTHQKFGAAVDIGTTTIACYLMDLNSGTQVHAASVQNPQSPYGADVISRINYCLEHDNGISTLSRKLKHTISELLTRACRAAGIKEKHVYECVLVGNTTMNHLFWELNPVSLCRVPFAPVTRQLLISTADGASVSGMNPNGKVIFLPCIGGFVGSDTLGAMIASDLAHKQGNTLIIDLGTNGEIVLGTGKKIYACSAAAGPAFEGASIDHGMQAFSGAINSARIDDDLHYTTIDNRPARGICGSGLIDMVSQLLSAGIINESGRIAEPDTVENQNLARRIIKENRRKKFLLCPNEDSGTGEAIYISQKDIRELQLAKGAIRAAVNILLKVAGVDFKHIDRIFLAGAFGNFINKESARKIGVFPDIALNRVISLGNAAGEGAKLALCDKHILQQDMPGTTLPVQHVPVSNHQDFEDEFVLGMSF